MRRTFAFGPLALVVAIFLLTSSPDAVQPPDDYSYWVRVAPERTDGEPYDRPRWNVPDTEIWRLDGSPPFTPYSCTPIETVGRGDGLDREHIVSLREAWDSRPAWWTQEHLSRFASRHMNLTLAQASANRSKGARDLSEWQPEHNSAWLAHQTLRVKAAYGLSVDLDELEALVTSINRGPVYVKCP